MDSGFAGVRVERAVPAGETGDTETTVVTPEGSTL